MGFLNNIKDAKEKVNNFKAKKLDDKIVREAIKAKEKDEKNYKAYLDLAEKVNIESGMDVVEARRITTQCMIDYLQNGSKVYDRI